MVRAGSAARNDRAFTARQPAAGTRGSGEDRASPGHKSSLPVDLPMVDLPDDRLEKASTSAC